jgi:trk system potassium uptake protein
LADRHHDVVVIGLGRFGGAVARSLCELRYEVLGIDSDERLVQMHSRFLTHVVQADATSYDAMEQLGAAQFKTAIVGIGNHVESSILATALMLDFGIERVWAKAITRAHGKILERIGAHKVVFPEREAGIRLAHTLVGQTLDYLELDEGFAVAELRAPELLLGRTLSASEVRRRHGITVVCIKPADGQFTYATQETVVSAGDILVVAGETARVDAFTALR